MGNNAKKKDLATSASKGIVARWRYNFPNESLSTDVLDLSEGTVAITKKNELIFRFKSKEVRLQYSFGDLCDALGIKLSKEEYTVEEAAGFLKGKRAMVLKGEWKLVA
jgi:hypothetical protein